MLNEYLNYLHELNLPGKCNRLKNKIKFHRDELKEEISNLKKCKTYWLRKEKFRRPEFNNPKYRKERYEACIKSTNQYIQRRKELLSDTMKKYQSDCR